MRNRIPIAQVASAFLLALLVIAGTGLAAQQGRTTASREAGPRVATSTANRHEHSSSHSPAPDPREPLSLDEIEIHGELLVPQAVYIVAGAEDDSAAAARVHDYLDYLGPGTERIGLLLLVGEPELDAPSSLSNSPSAAPAAAPEGER